MFFKFFNTQDKYNTFQFKDGLNTDSRPFNNHAREDCVRGALYFADENNIMRFFNPSCDFIREVDVPKDIAVGSFGGKCMTKTLFLHEKRDLSDVSTWEWLFSKGVVVTANNALALVSGKGHLEVVKFLVSKGADVNACNNYAVWLASQNGHLEIVKYLVSQGADITVDAENYAVRVASREGHLEVVKYLVSIGADVTADGNWSIHEASMRGHLAVVEYLVSVGADINSYDNRAVKWASEEGHLDVVKYLVSKGADVTSCGNHTIMGASLKGHLDVVEYLVSQGVTLPKEY